jgi:excinuclease ABC subunit A
MSITSTACRPRSPSSRRRRRKNPRSTVGTVTEIYDYLRLLFARVGVPYSPATGLPIESQTVSQMADRDAGAAERHAALPQRADRARPQGRVPQGIRRLQKKGFQRVKVDGKYYEIADVPTLDKKLKHDIEVVVDRWSSNPTSATACPIPSRPRSSWRRPRRSPNSPMRRKTASRASILMSSKFACPVSGFTIEEIEPRLFSFNNPHGACPACDGLGTQLYFDPALIVPDRA